MPIVRAINDPMMQFYDRARNALEYYKSLFVKPKSNVNNLELVRFPDGSSGEYNADINTIRIDRKLRGDKFNNTYAHEYQHKLQHLRGTPATYGVPLFGDNSNYKSPDMDFKHYLEQPMEVEARQAGNNYEIDMMGDEARQAIRLNNMKRLFNMGAISPQEQKRAESNTRLFTKFSQPESRYKDVELNRMNPQTAINNYYYPKPENYYSPQPAPIIRRP